MKAGTRARQLIEYAHATNDIHRLIEYNTELAQIIVSFAGLQGNAEVKCAELKETFKQAEAAKVLTFEGSVAAGERNAVIELADMRMELFKHEASVKQIALFRSALSNNCDVIKQKIAFLRSEWELTKFQQSTP
jgi:hypothetical protein